MTKPKRWNLTATILPVAAIVSGCAMFKDPPEDRQIAATVRSQLWKHELPATSISVSARNHVVYLSGLVDTDLEVGEAETVADGVPGVERVINSLVAEQ